MQKIFWQRNSVFTRFILAIQLLVTISITTVATAQTTAPLQQNYDIAIGGLLDEEGVLSLPQGFSGSIDPAGYQLLTDFEQTPRFVQSSESNALWSNGEFGIPGCSGNIIAMVAVNGELFLGGNFGSCGFATSNRIARYDPLTEEFSSLGSGIASGSVKALAVIGTDLYIGGNFREVGGLQANYVAVYDTTQVGDEGWSALGSGVGDALINSVYALAAIGTDLYVAGDFNVAGGKPANRIAVFDTTLDGDAGWSPLGSGVSGTSVFLEVKALEVNGTNLYVGGNFNQAGQISARGIAVYDTNLEGDTGWSSLGNGIAGDVEALELAGTNLYVGGRFGLAGGALARNIAVFDTLQSDDAGWSTLGSGLDFTVFALTSIGTDLYVGGSFTEAGGKSANSVALFDTTMVGDTGWFTLGEGLDSGVRSLAAIGADLYVGGVFGFAGGEPAKRIAIYDTSITSNGGWSALGSGINNTVLALEVIDSALYVAGGFRRVGTIPASRIAVYKPNQAGQYSWHSLGDGVDGSVHALGSHGSKLYVGGEFNLAGGVAANNIAVFDTDQSGNSGWSSIGSGTNGNFSGFNGVRAIAIKNNILYIGGWFTSVGYIDAIGIASYDLTQSADAGWSTLGAELNGIVLALELIGSDLYIAGRFTQAGGLRADNIVRYDTTSSSSSAWGTLGSGVSFQTIAESESPPRFGSVRALESVGDVLYMGGLFDTAGNQNANSIALYDTTQAGDSGWAVLGSGVRGRVYSMNVIGTDLYVGGNLSEAGGQSVSEIAVYDTSQSGDGAWSSLGTGIFGIFVFDMANIGSDLFVGGSFSLAGSFVNGNLARLRADLSSVGIPVASFWGGLVLCLVMLAVGLLQLRKPYATVY